MSRGAELRSAAGRHDIPDRLWRHRASRRRRQMPLWQELPLLLLVAFGLAVLIRTFLLQAFYIPSGSMENTLLVGDRVLVNKVVYNLRSPVRGEVVVFRGPSNWTPESNVPQSTGLLSQVGRTMGDLVGVAQPDEKDFIKRIIGLPGDVVACCDQGHVTVNGVPLNEPYITEDSPLDADPVTNRCGPRRFGPVTVAPGDMWVMGDHRLVSQDSRCQGEVPMRNIIGKAFVVVWPRGDWAALNVPSTFSKVPRPYNAEREPTVPVRVPGADLVLMTPILASMSFSSRSRLYWRSPRRRLHA
ncbi:MAG: signal peptidase I [Micromonosporaceae bacterium]|nr:signal peptidase I [Micromonosporaceae bacterium]